MIGSSVRSATAWIAASQSGRASALRQAASTGARRTLRARARAWSGKRARDRCDSIACSSLSTPSPVVAVVTSTVAACAPPGHRRDSMARSCRAARSAPGRSPLPTAITSAISSSPALMAWTSSPISGTSTTTVVSASRATRPRSARLPPSRSRSGRSPRHPGAATASQVAAASPPSSPREAIDRMKTSRSAACSIIRMRSPMIAPPVYGELGSTASTPTRLPAARQAAIRALTSVDLPLPGGPVIPTTCAPCPAAKAPAGCPERRIGRLDARQQRASGRRSRTPAPSAGPGQSPGRRACSRK